MSVRPSIEQVVCTYCGHRQLKLRWCLGVKNLVVVLIAYRSCCLQDQHSDCIQSIHIYQKIFKNPGRINCTREREREYWRLWNWNSRKKQYNGPKIYYNGTNNLKSKIKPCGDWLYMNHDSVSEIVFVSFLYPFYSPVWVQVRNNSPWKKGTNGL